MTDSILVKYDGSDENGFDLGLLGVSFTGTSAAFKELCVMVGIDGEIEIRTSKITHGSVDVHNQILVTYTSLPFNTPKELYDFLRVADPLLLKAAQDFFTGTLGVNKSLNDFYTAYPFDAALLTYLIGKFLVRSLRWISKQKTQYTTRDAELGEISSRQAKRYRSMIQRGKFRRVLKPMTDGSITSINISTSNATESSVATITESDIEKYLPDEAQILPEYINGSHHTLTGCLVSLQSARGEIIKIQANEIPQPHSLITARPHDGESTVDYAPFYRKDVSFTVEVLRASMYKRPEFIVLEMDISQTQLI